MNFIRKLFEGKVDESVHRQFTRYSKGVFENRALVEISRSKKKIKIKTSFEYADDLARYLADTDEEFEIDGIIITKEKVDFGFDVSVKKFAGINSYEIVHKYDRDSFIDLLDKFSGALSFFSLTTKKGSLKSKKKAPNPKKSGKGEEPRPDFCTFSSENLEILQDFGFDFSDEFSKAKINHTFSIDEIVIPEEYKNNFAGARLHGKRKGKIIRKLNVDGKVSEKSIGFIA